MEHSILFLPSNRTVMGQTGKTILQMANGLGLDAPCAGNGTCGKCKVQIIKGETTALTAQESKNLTAEELAAGYRLACQVEPLSPIVVVLPDKSEGSKRKKHMNALPDSFVPQVPTQKHYVTIPKATLQQQLDHCSRIQNALGQEQLTFSLPVLQQISDVMTAKREKVTVTTYQNQVLAVEAGDTTQHHYGVAVDIGTTTVVAMLWNMNTVTCVDVEAATNPQSAYGADVISRIQFTMEQDGNTKILQQAIRDCINTAIQSLCNQNGINPEHIYHMTVVGNTTMSHLFLGISPKSLARVPFAPAFHKGIWATAKQLNLSINPNGVIYVLPNIAGHVGSDITGVLLAMDLFHLSGRTVAIDIGTNGEILVADNGRVLTCSTAAGPAFEGASIHAGMRAIRGAIESVTIQEDVHIKVIEDAPPMGLCGTGLIDAVAALKRTGLLQQNGALLTQAEAVAKDYPSPLTERLFGQGNTAGFALSKGESPVSLLQADIREVQLAKGAILGGIETLMQQLHFTTADIDRVIVAGAFGSYINHENAKVIGLLPNVPLERIHAIGNGAGSGAVMALLSEQYKQKAELETENITHVELSQDEYFQDCYIENMLF